VPHDSPKTWALEAGDEDTGEGEAVFFNLPTDFRPVQVSDSELTAALTTFGLHESYEAQRAFGLLAIENIKKGIW
jgi:hypothetical protein